MNTPDRSADSSNSSVPHGKQIPDHLCRTFPVIYHDRWIFRRSCIAISHNCRNVQFFRKALKHSLMCGHIDNTIHLLRNKLLYFFLDHRKKLLVFIIAFTEFPIKPEIRQQNMIALFLAAFRDSVYNIRCTECRDVLHNNTDRF